MAHLAGSRDPDDEQQLARATAERLHLALEAGKLGDWSWDALSDVVTLSGRAAAMFGLGDRLRITWTEMRERLLHPDDREPVGRAVEVALRDRSDYDVEYRVPRRDGSDTWIAARGRGVYRGDGGAIGMIGVVLDVTERKQLEIARARLAAVVEASEDAIVTKTLEGTITSWNAGAQRMFGYTAKEVIGRPVTILIPPERHAEEREILRRLAAGQRIEHFETVRVRKDGARLDVSLSVSPVRDERGVLAGASKIARDISVRKRSEEALREQARILAILNETGRRIAADLDLQSIVQAVTDAATHLSGARYGAFFHNVRDEQGNSYQLFTLTGAPREAFERFGHPRATPIFEPTFRGQGPIRLDDVTADPRYGTMAPHQGMPAGHVPIRSYLAVPVVSRAGDVIGGIFLGHPEPGVFSERAEQLVLGVAAQAAIAIDNARLYDNTRRSAEERQRLLEGERAARAEAERVSLLKDEFLATLSHELRTPLNAIVGWAHVLRDQGRGNAEIEEGLAIIDRNARVQAQLIEDLLDMSRIVSGKIRLDVQRVELHEVVRAAVESVRHSADAKGVRLEVLLDPLAGPVWGDPNRLQQCCWNLLSNAIKFTPRGGRVQVTLARVESHVEVRFVDTGSGISAEFLPHVFERFRQEDASTTRRFGGLGLGLSIVKNLVELHGGTVEARSAGLGRGATFQINLPLMVVAGPKEPARAHPRAERGAAIPGDHPSLDGITVLMVDDEADARQLVKRILEDCGARVLLAESAADAFELVGHEHPDVILSDIGMPEEDGYSFVRRLRQLTPGEGGRIPAAALTAFARAEDRTRALRAGYQTHVVKPVDADELTAVVASLAMRGS